VKKILYLFIYQLLFTSSLFAQVNEKNHYIGTGVSGVFYSTNSLAILPEINISGKIRSYSIYPLFKFDTSGDCCTTPSKTQKLNF